MPGWFWLEHGICDAVALTRLPRPAGLQESQNHSQDVLLTPLFLERDRRTQHLYVQEASHFTVSVLGRCQESLNCEKHGGNSHSPENTFLLHKEKDTSEVGLSPDGAGHTWRDQQ